MKNFINTVILVARIFPGLKDKFLARKLYDKLSDFVLVYSDKTGGNVAQSSRGGLLASINNLLDVLDYLEHSKTGALTPLLYARRNLLALKLQLIRTAEKPSIIEKEKKEEVSPVFPTPMTRIKKEADRSGNKEKIYNYIKRSPNSRTKDIVYEFSILSERTVKRNLKELVGDGLLKRVSKNKAVYYHA